MGAPLGSPAPPTPGTPSARGAQGVPPRAHLALSAVAPVVVGSLQLPHTPLPPVSPTTRVWGAVPPAMPHSSRLYPPSSQADKTTDTGSAPPPVPVSFPAPLITSGSFLPGNPGSCSLAMPPPHQLPSTVLLGGPTSYLVLSLRDRSPRPCCRYVAGSTLPKPLPAGPAAWPKPALAAGPTGFSCW